jgi:hypothetical protein
LTFLPQLKLSKTTFGWCWAEPKLFKSLMPTQLKPYYVSAFERARKTMDTAIMIEALICAEETHINSGQYMMAFPKVNEVNTSFHPISSIKLHQFREPIPLFRE